MKLFLTSFFSDVAHKLPEFVGGDMAGKTVTFIPTAANVEEVTFFVDKAKEAFTKIGVIIHELDIETAAYETIQTAFKDNDFIYVSGGNTFYLQHILKEKHVEQLLVDAVNDGKVYIGESAGSIILAPNIKYITSMEDLSKVPQPHFNGGLGLIDFYPLPHKDNDHFKDLVDEIIREDLVNLVPITDYQAIIYQDGQLEIVE